MKQRVGYKWSDELNLFEEHGLLDSCSDYLPKPKRKYSDIVVQCRKCGGIFVGAIVPPTGTPFWKIGVIKGENK